MRLAAVDKEAPAAGFRPKGTRARSFAVSKDRAGRGRGAGTAQCLARCRVRSAPLSSASKSICRPVIGPPPAGPEGRWAIISGSISISRAADVAACAGAQPWSRWRWRPGLTCRRSQVGGASDTGPAPHGTTAWLGCTSPPPGVRCALRPSRFFVAILLLYVVANARQRILRGAHSSPSLE